nr:MAG TPA: hypothetical protein [Caudoviricetes sp.]
MLKIIAENGSILKWVLLEEMGRGKFYAILELEKIFQFVQ